MSIKRTNLTTAFYSILLLTALLSTTSCEENNIRLTRDTSDAFIITEVMAANRSHVVSNSGNIYDWIEIKNISEEPASPSGLTLMIEKDTPADTIAQKKSKYTSWPMPDIEVAPGGYIVICAAKKKGAKSQDPLIAPLKIPSKGGRVLLAHDKEVLSALEYDPLEEDECCRLLSDGSTEKSYYATPGYENSDSGYVSYSAHVAQNQKSPLRLWELHSKGDKTGNAWIELKNVSEQPISLKDYSLTTNPKKLHSWQFPEVELKPGGIYVVQGVRGGFKIGGNRAVILSKDGKIVDTLSDAPAPFGMSAGHVDGQPGRYFFPSPTRNAENTSPGYPHIAPRPLFSPNPGAYAAGTTMRVEIDTHGFTVHYTTDGSQPTSDSPIYRNPIPVDKTTKIRAYCQGDSLYAESSTATATFILDGTHTLPVVNITMKSSDLYDYNTGIYEAGPGASPEYPHTGANYWKKWWKKAHIEFCDGKEGFSENCQIAIFGGFSRALAKKSFKIRFRDTDGASHVTYDFFNKGKAVKLKKFILRSGSQDINGVMVRDEFFTSLMQPQSPTLLIQDYRPVALYINGEYFGLYYIREKIDNDFVARKLKTSDDNISILFTGKYLEEGSASDYHALMSFARSHDMTVKENYEHICSKFDVVGLIDFKLGQLYSSNVDIGNVRYVRSEDEKSDKKWYIVFYDLDLTWSQNRLADYYLRANGPENIGSPSLHNKLISLLLKNKEFRQLFLERLSMHLHTTFTTANTTAVFDNLISTIKPEMARNCERWPNVMRYSTWESNVEKFREKFKTRNQIILNSIRSEIGITAEEEKKYFSDLGY